MSEIENLKELRIKYLNGNRRTKEQILTSLCLVHGYHRKSAIRVLYRELGLPEAQRPRKKQKPGARSQYIRSRDLSCLEGYLEKADYMCSKNLKRAVPIWPSTLLPNCHQKGYHEPGEELQKLSPTVHP
jgi:hypothetical protein